MAIINIFWDEIVKARAENLGLTDESIILEALYKLNEKQNNIESMLFKIGEKLNLSEDDF